MTDRERLQALVDDPATPEGIARTAAQRLAAMARRANAARTETTETGLVWWAQKSGRTLDAARIKTYRVGGVKKLTKRICVKDAEGDIIQGYSDRP